MCSNVSIAVGTYLLPSSAEMDVSKCCSWSVHSPDSPPQVRVCLTETIHMSAFFDDGEYFMFHLLDPLIQHQQIMEVGITVSSINC